MNTIFGPVPSRRLGRSLGIDVIPPKTCTYDCIYCESGRTTHLTVCRKAFTAPENVLHDLEDYFRAYPGGADVLTFSSAGEPTLYEPLGELIPAIKRRFPGLPLIVLTNGSLLRDPNVRKDLLQADRVVPTFTGFSREVFESVHRPHPDLDINDVVKGMEAFRREYKGLIFLEIMLVGGRNDTADHWATMRRIVERTQPDRVELNTVVRPPADPGITGLPPERMEAALKYFPAERSRIIGSFCGSGLAEKDLSLSRRILELVGRRPCTVPEMTASLGVPVKDLEAAISRLRSANRLTSSRFTGKEYYRLPE